MKTILFLLLAFTFFGCTGYEPLFSSKNLSFYIENIQNINGDGITRKIANNLSGNKIKSGVKNNYTLKISSYLKDNITSKNSKGDAATYELIISVEVKVYNGNSNYLIDTLNFNKKSNYNNRINKFDLSQYKKVIKEELINKISEDIIIKLQSL